MQDFIVLGIIPGTHIQLSFTFWVCAGLGFFGLLLLVRLARSHVLRNYIAGLQIAHTIDDFDLIAL